MGYLPQRGATCRALRRASWTQIPGKYEGTQIAFSSVLKSKVGGRDVALRQTKTFRPSSPSHNCKSYVKASEYEQEEIELRMEALSTVPVTLLGFLGPK
jgi:hypothetical protein